MKTQFTSAVNDDDVYQPQERRVLVLKGYASEKEIRTFGKTYKKLVARTTSPPPEDELARKMLVRHMEKSGRILSDFVSQAYTTEKYVLGFEGVKDLLATIQRPQWAKDMLTARKIKEETKRRDNEN